MTNIPSVLDRICESVAVDEWHAIDPPLDPYSADPFDGQASDGILSELLSEWFEGVDTDGTPLFLIGWSPELVVVAEPRVRWHGPSTPLLHSGVQILVRSTDDQAITSAVKEIVARRRRSFRRCGTCGIRTPPEHREGSVCHSCMEEQGTVF